VSESPGRVRIRIARAHDEASLAQLDADAWSPASGFPSVLQRAPGTFFTPGNPPHIHLVAETDGAVAGYVRLKPPTSLPENVHVIEVAGLAVAPAARRRGVATALLAAAGRRARTQGASKLSLRVLSTNETAIRLYERAGFQREGVLRGEFLINGQYVDDVLMARQLGDNAT
jgi:ribosomal protein S18 acetylase RimI-like enzyme